MGNLGPVYLAWSHLWHKRSGLVQPLLVMVVCLLLLFMQVGLYLMPQPAGSVPPENTVNEPHPQGEKESDAGRHEIAQTIGTITIGLLVLLLFRYVLATEMAGHFRELAMLHTIGYSPVHLYAVFFAKMLLLELLAFAPAVALAPGVDLFIRAWTDWPLSLSLPRLGIVLLAALALGILAAWLAIPRKLRTADPTEIFG